MGGVGHSPSRGRLESSSRSALSDFNSLGVAKSDVCGFSTIYIIWRWHSALYPLLPL